MGGGEDENREREAEAGQLVPVTTRKAKSPKRTLPEVAEVKVRGRDRDE